MNWYLIEERTPKENKPIIVTDLKGNYSTGNYNNIYEYDVLSSYYFMSSKDVKAWAYIEEPNSIKNKNKIIMASKLNKDEIEEKALLDSIRAINFSTGGGSINIHCKTLEENEFIVDLLYDNLKDYIQYKLISNRYEKPVVTQIVVRDIFDMNSTVYLINDFIE